MVLFLQFPQELKVWMGFLLFIQNTASTDRIVIAVVGITTLRCDTLLAIMNSLVLIFNLMLLQSCHLQASPMGRTLSQNLDQFETSNLNSRQPINCN